MPRSCAKNEWGQGLREMKKRLCGINLEDRKSLGGRNRLTDKMIDKFQNSYGLAIRRNTGDLDGMITSIWAVYEHMIMDDQTPLPEQHGKCPKTSDTWCKYWRARFDHSLTYDQSARLPQIFREQLKPIFTRLSNRDLLRRCLMGLTQNQNESINGVLWKMIPKTRFCGKTRVQSAVGKTVLHFNSGSTSKAGIFNFLGMVPGENFFTISQSIDQERIKNAERKVSDKERLARKQRRAVRKKYVVDDRVNYMPGGFGIGKEPENLEGDIAKDGNAGKSSKKPKKKNAKKPTEPPTSDTENADFNTETVEVQFVDDNKIINWIK